MYDFEILEGRKPDLSFFVTIMRTNLKRSRNQSSFNLFRNSTVVVKSEV